MYWWAIHELEKQAISSETHQFQAGLDFHVAFRAFLEKDFKSCFVYTQNYLEKIPNVDLLISFGSERDGYHPVWDIYLSDGPLVETEKWLVKLLDLWSKTQNKPFYAHLCLDYGRLLYEWNHIDEAKKYIQTTLTIGKQYIIIDKINLLL